MIYVNLTHEHNRMRIDSDSSSNLDSLFHRRGRLEQIEVNGNMTGQPDSADSETFEFPVDGTFANAESISNLFAIPLIT